VESFSYLPGSRLGILVMLRIWFRKHLYEFGEFTVILEKFHPD
jgi:hypothetical protein